MNWQPIDTAPKDGSRLILYVPEYRAKVWIGSYDRTEHIRNGEVSYLREGWNIGLFGSGDPIPTHWMPIPDIPCVVVDK